MEQKTLSQLRLIIPGIFAIIIGTSYYFTITNKSFQEVYFTEYLIPFLIAIGFIALFSLTKIRFLISNYFQKKFKLIIKNQIVKSYTKGLTKKQKQYLYKNNTLKNVVFKIIENNESLKKKLTHSFFNGLIWTSIADLLIISFLFSFVYFLSIIIFEEAVDKLIIGGITMILITFTTLITHILAFLRLSRLSSEQIEHIETKID